MSLKSKRYWSGHLHEGDLVMYQGKPYEVASLVYLKRMLSVPAGHVPIFIRDSKTKLRVVVVPFDDVSVYVRRS